LPFSANYRVQKEAGPRRKGDSVVSAEEGGRCYERRAALLYGQRSSIKKSQSNRISKRGKKEATKEDFRPTVKKRAQRIGS